MSEWNDPFLKELFFSQTPLVDVRAPVEFSEGSIPHSLNLPIMNDEERRLVGTCYKEKGQEDAILLGHNLVKGEIKRERVQKWLAEIKARPETQFFCFRGGLRSQIACQWIREAGVDRQPIPGGYKRMRRFFLSYLEQANFPNLIRLGGLTGSGKTIVLNTIGGSIDLEKLASHRGSAFGGMGAQPSQVRFENELSLELMRVNDLTLVEDESAMIGRIVIPKRFHLHMRNSPLIILKCDEEERIQNIFADYVLGSDLEKLSIPLLRIAKALGGARFKEISDLMKAAFELEKTPENHAEWIKKLLHYYYDPLYQKDLKQQGTQVLFEGPAEEIHHFITSQNKS